MLSVLAEEIDKNLNTKRHIQNKKKSQDEIYFLTKNKLIVEQNDSKIVLKKLIVMNREKGHSDEKKIKACCNTTSFKTV